MYLVFYIFLLCLFLYKIFDSKESFISTIMNTSPNSMLEGMYKRIHPYVPFKSKFYKLRRHLRSK
jgi:hypothetical protein